jgi:hypothetical protein
MHIIIACELQQFQVPLTEWFLQMRVIDTSGKLQLVGFIQRFFKKLGINIQICATIYAKTILINTFNVLECR